MADLSVRERLQPALLDRLTDDAPEHALESRDAGTITPARLLKAVRRDLEWLLNAVQLSGDVDWEGAPSAARSVINFGLPPLSGETASTLNIAQLESNIRRAIIDFEPRIDPSSVRVRTVGSQVAMEQHNLIQFEIQGSLWGQHQRSDLMLRTQLDLETGQVYFPDEA